MGGFARRERVRYATFIVLCPQYIELLSVVVLAFPGQHSPVDAKELFGLRLQALRKERGLSQERLAELIDRSKDAVSKMERGINFPAFDTLLKLSEMLGVPLVDIVGDIDRPGVTVQWVALHARLAVTVQDLDEKTLGVLVDQAEALRRLAPAPPRKSAFKAR